MCSGRLAADCSIDSPIVRTESFSPTRTSTSSCNAFKKSGFRGGLNWYRCIDRSWEESAGQTDRIEQPALMITAERDVVLRPEMAEGMTTWVPNLRKTVLVKGSGHWTQQEKPAEVNAAILDFLSDLKK